MYTGNKSLKTEIMLGPGQSLSGCYNSERKSEEEKMPSVGTFPRDLDILANVMTFFRIKSVISSPSAYYFFAGEFFHGHKVSLTKIYPVNFGGVPFLVNIFP